MSRLPLSLLLYAALGACGGDGMDDADPGEMENMSMAGASTSGDAPAALNGCKASTYEDHSAEDDERLVLIAVEGLTFTPPCMAIAVGQSVKFEGSLAAHPLAPGNPDDSAAGTPDNPIAATSSGTSVEFVFDSPGTYPFYCELHAFGSGMGMAGAVYVR